MVQDASGGQGRRHALPTHGGAATTTGCGNAKGQKKGRGIVLMAVMRMKKGGGIRFRTRMMSHGGAKMMTRGATGSALNVLMSTCLRVFQCLLSRICGRVATRHLWQGCDSPLVAGLRLATCGRVATRHTCYTSIMTSTAYAQCYQSSDDSVNAFI